MALILACVVWAVAGPENGRAFDVRAFALLTLAFIVAESTAVELPFRRGGWTYAFGEVPLAAGLVLTEPIELLGAALTGYALALLLVLRVATTKVIFNLAQGALSTVLAIAIVEFAVGDADRLASESWPVVLLAVVTATGSSAVMVIAVLRSTDHDAPAGKLLRTGAFSMLVAAANAAVALSAAVVVDAQPVAAALLLIPTLALFVSYRSYVNEHTQREAIESLYLSSVALARRGSPGGSGASLALMLAELSSMFRASVAEAIVRSAEVGGGVTTVVAVDGRVNQLPGDISLEQLVAMGEALPQEPVIVSARDPDARFEELLRRHGQREAMIGRLGAGGQLLGVLTVAGPRGQVRSFTHAELRLFGTLLHHAAAAFENGRLEVAIDEMREIERQLAHEALHDPLTGLANRTRFSRELAAVVGRGDAGHALALVDLDDFKAINDTYGHAVGDEVLVEVGHRLAGAMRSTDLVARLGGDEFAVLFAADADLLPAAERMLAALSAPFEFEGRVIDLGASVGVVRIDGSEDPERLLRTADAAMYSAKASGKGTVTEFDATSASRRRGQRSVAEELRDAASGDEIELAFQPIIDLRTTDLVGVEAFARWQIDGETRAAGEFLPELASAGLVHEMDRLLVEGTRAALLLATSPQRRLAVWKNVSVASLRDGTLIDLLVEGLGEDARSRLTIEVPASEVGDHRAVHEVLERVSEHGVKVALDGVGAGHSALPLLRPGVVDVFKVRATDIGERLEPLLAYARALGADVVVTGVETDEQLDAVRRSGCDRAQGIRLASTVDLEQLGALVGRRTVAPSG